MIQVLITRSQEDSEPLSEILEKEGISSSLLPLQEMHVFPLVFPLSDIQGIIFTSKNGVRSFCHFYADRQFWVYCVGDGTANTAKAMGFKHVKSAKGAGQELVDLIQETCDPKGCPLVHISGKDISFSLEEALPSFPIQRIIGYEMVDQLELIAPQIAMLQDPKITHVVLFSPQSAQRFVKVMNKYGSEKSCESRTCVAFSQQVSEKLNELEWKEIVVLDHPSQEALLEYFDGINKENHT